MGCRVVLKIRVKGAILFREPEKGPRTLSPCRVQASIRVKGAILLRGPEKGPRTLSPCRVQASIPEKRPEECRGMSVNVLRWEPAASP